MAVIEFRNETIRRAQIAVVKDQHVRQPEQRLSEIGRQPFRQYIGENDRTK
jgi:hypothetical protein